MASKQMGYLYGRTKLVVFRLGNHETIVGVASGTAIHFPVKTTNCGGYGAFPHMDSWKWNHTSDHMIHIAQQYKPT